MGIKDRIAAEQQAKGKFFLVGGQRLDGKSTLGGTLRGKTLFLQADLLETGSSSAAALAESLGNKLDVLSFTDMNDLLSIMKDKEALQYDNIYVDGLSAINEQVSVRDDFKKASRANIWDAFRLLGDEMRRFLLEAKKLTREHKINVGVTLAYKLKDTNGTTSLEPDVKGNVTISEIQRLVPIVLAVRKKFDEEGNLKRVLVTKSDELYPARIDSVLDGNNKGEAEANLGDLLEKLN